MICVMLGLTNAIFLCDLYFYFTGTFFKIINDFNNRMNEVAFLYYCLVYVRLYFSLDPQK